MISENSRKYALRLRSGNMDAVNRIIETSMRSWKRVFVAVQQCSQVYVHQNMLWDDVAPVWL